MQRPRRRAGAHPARPLGALLLAAAAAPPIAVVASVAFVRSRARGHLHPEHAVPPAPVALVLGAEVHPDGRPSSFLAARLDLAARLLRAGTVQALLLSGDAAAPEYDEPTAMRRYLIAAGIPADRLVVDPFGLDTYDSCFRAQRVFGVTDLVVVTQSYHLPRAVGTARALGLRADGVGDVSTRRVSRAWVRGLLRDQVACVKTVLDLARRRQPMLGPSDPSVAEALGRL